MIFLARHGTLEDPLINGKPDPMHTREGLSFLEFMADCALVLCEYLDEQIKLIGLGSANRYKDMERELRKQLPEVRNFLYSPMFGLGDLKTFDDYGGVIYVTTAGEVVPEESYMSMFDYLPVWKIMEDVESAYEGNKLLCVGGQFIDLFKEVDKQRDSIYRVDFKKEKLILTFRDGRLLNLPPRK